MLQTASTTSSKPAANTTPLPKTAAPETKPATNLAKKYTDEQIKSLTDLGASREEAIRALDMCNGNPELAANALFPF